MIRILAKLYMRVDKLPVPQRQQALQVLQDEEQDIKRWPDLLPRILADAERAITSLEEEAKQV
jgi:hypothetical protein